MIMTRNYRWFLLSHSPRGAWHKFLQTVFSVILAVSELVAAQYVGQGIRHMGVLSGILGLFWCIRTSRPKMLKMCCFLFVVAVTKHIHPHSEGTWDSI
jgi:hypothetical protein